MLILKTSPYTLSQSFLDHPLGCCRLGKSVGGTRNLGEIFTARPELTTSGGSRGAFIRRRTSTVCIFATSKLPSFAVFVLSTRQLLQIFSISLLKSLINIIIINDIYKGTFFRRILQNRKNEKVFHYNWCVCLEFLIPLSVKTLNKSNFRKKLKSVLLNVLDHEDSYMNVIHLLEIFYEVNLIICCIYLCL